ncbi:MAG: ATP-binding protein, partial [Hyphomicrobiaceae bacterium]
GQRDEPLKRNLLPFVGRETERAQFISVMESVPARDTGAAFILRGEPGIGKTRLATEWLASARASGFASHHVLVLDFGSATGNDPLRAIFRSLLGIDSLEDDPRLRLAPTARGLLEDSDFHPDDEAFVDDLLGLPMSSDVQAYYRAIENTARNRRKIELVGRLLENRARRQPQILLIEDLHWSDQLTQDLCATLVTRCSNSPALMLMTSRIEGDPFDQSWRSATGNTPIYTIDLRPLSSRETRELAKVSGVDQAQALSAEIEKAGGNPLFLEMMIRSTADSQTDALSGNLRSMVQARIDKLEPIDRRAIQAASVVGQRFDLALLQHLIDEPDYSPQGLLTRSLVSPLGDQYLFAHALVQEGVYASVTRRNAQAMHLKAANWYAERDLLLHAEHLAKADEERAASAYLNASLCQSELLRFETASNLLRKGVALADSLEDRFALNKALGDVAMQRNDLETANSAYKAALLTNPSEAEQVRLCLGVASSNRDQADDVIAEAVEYLDKAQELNTRLASDEVCVEIDSLRSLVNYSIGNLAEAYQGAQTAVEHAEKIGSPDLLLRALESFNAANYQFGRFKMCRTLGQRIIEIAQAENNIRFEIVGSYQVTVGYHYNNEFARAIQASALPIASGAKYGSLRQACLANEYIARTYICMGDLESARAHAEESLRIAQSANITLREALALIKLAEVSIEEGDTNSAQSLAQRAIDLSDGPYTAPWSLATLALAAPNFEQAQERFRKAEEIMSAQSSSSHNHFHVRKAQIDTALKYEDWTLAERAADHLEAFTGPEPLPWTSFHIRRGRLIAKLGRGEQDEQSAQLLEELSKTCNETGMKAQLPEGALIGSECPTAAKVSIG